MKPGPKKGIPSANTRMQWFRQILGDKRCAELIMQAHREAGKDVRQNG